MNGCIVCIHVAHEMELTIYGFLVLIVFLYMSLSVVFSVSTFFSSRFIPAWKFLKNMNILLHCVDINASNVHVDDACRRHHLNRDFFVFGKIEVSNIMFHDNTRIFKCIKN